MGITSMPEVGIIGVLAFIIIGLLVEWAHLKGFGRDK
jgi:hypothetical protein